MEQDRLGTTGVIHSSTAVSTFPQATCWDNQGHRVGGVRAGSKRNCYTYPLPSF